MRLVTVDVDDAAGLEHLWAELKHHRAILNADPGLRAHIIRRCERLPAATADPILKDLDEVHPEVVLESWFETLVANKRTYGWFQRNYVRSARAPGVPHAPQDEHLVLVATEMLKTGWEQEVVRRAIDGLVSNGR